MNDRFVKAMESCSVHPLLVGLIKDLRRELASRVAVTDIEVQSVLADVDAALVIITGEGA